jgi:hypothetical protein
VRRLHNELRAIDLDGQVDVADEEPGLGFRQQDQRVALVVDFVRDAAGNVTEFVMVQGTRQERVDTREVTVLEGRHHPRPRP